MYKATVRAMIRRNLRKLNEGNYEPALAMFRGDATLTFPGDNSWANQHRPTERGREAFATHRGRGRYRSVPAAQCRGPHPPGGRRHPRQRPPMEHAGGDSSTRMGRGPRWARPLQQPGGAVRQHHVGQDPPRGGLPRHRAHRRPRRFSFRRTRWPGVHERSVSKCRQSRRSRAQPVSHSVITGPPNRWAPGPPRPLRSRRSRTAIAASTTSSAMIVVAGCCAGRRGVQFGDRADVAASFCSGRQPWVIQPGTTPCRLSPVGRKGC